MDIEFLCEDFKCDALVRRMRIKARGVEDIELSDIAQKEVLRMAISKQNIIQHLECEGYTVTKY
ncbi:hypothetical protein KUA07_08940 [Proteus mirabilis]|uniref:hypothetical protein n=1 Tax=Proteus mirabilis TaxID=584 RepID=UPI001BAF57A0|nr:hypothetical protein [Proteus mirabilis]MBS3875894.1 hypothetical protein [Proteus mirabilis]MCT0236409.1 hypothetical protein [Proteus mirabilis]WOQ82941.1 hypothetical protein R2B79_14380 [Proteus mirabilis]HEK2594820.1 hypothetical protein [Proteus mirabilis]